MEPQLQPQPEQDAAAHTESGVVFGEGGGPRREATTPDPAKAWLAAAAVAGMALGVLLWRSPPQAPASVPQVPNSSSPIPAVPSPPSPSAAAPQAGNNPTAPVPVDLPKPAPQESADLRPFNPMELECRSISPATAMPGARLLGRGSTGRVHATIMPGDAGYNHSVYLGDRLIGTTRGASGAATVDLGSFAYGRELDFSIRVHETGRTYRAGPATRNGDKRVHAAITPMGVGAWRLGFEDLDGGGDADYNDAIVVIRGELAAESNGILKCSPSPPSPR